MVVELITMHGHWIGNGIPVFHGQRLDQGYAPLVVHDVQGLAFRIQDAVHGLSPNLEAAEVQPRLHGAVLLDHLPRAYPVAVVAVVGLGRAAGDMAQLFGEVPVHRAQVRHGRHGAVGVVGEVRGGAPDRGTCQAVAVRGVSVSPSPLRPIKLMNHRQDIPDAVVFPFAGIVPHGGAVLRADLRGIPVFAEKF